MRSRIALVHSEVPWLSATAAFVMTGALALLMSLPLSARLQDEPSAADANASDKKSQAADSSQNQSAGEEGAASNSSDQKSVKSYPVRNGTTTYKRTEEYEKKKTADGEIETERVREPHYGGDTNVRFEKETRTRKLSDGSVVREYVLKNPDGSGRMVPIEIIREKTRATAEGAVIERETLHQDSNGNWQPLRKEQVTETGEGESKRSVKEVRERNLAGDWKVVDRTVTTEKSSDSSKSSRAVRQVPNASGELADYEVSESSSTKDGDKETTEVTVRRRDTQDAINPKFILAERTRTEQTKSADGKTTRKSVTESDLLDHDASRNVTPGASKVVQEKVEVETTAADGSTHRTVTVKERGAVNREMHPAGQVVLEKDSQGNVRQILIPSN